MVAYALIRSSSQRPILTRVISILARKPTTMRSRREATNKHEPVEAITAPGTQTVDCVYREPGAPVWNRYFHALATAGARSVAVCLRLFHFVARLESRDSSSRLMVDLEAISGFMQCGGTVERKKQDDNGAQGYHRHAEPKEASKWLFVADFFV